MKVLFVSFEVAPIYKFGGLGDVAGSLPKALQKLGIESRVYMPRYKAITPVSHLPESVVPLMYARNELFLRSGIIGNNKNPRNRVIAFTYFSYKVIDDIRRSGFIPDILHLNEWHAGLAPYLLKEKESDPRLKRIKVIVTIHNSLYQGIFLIEDILSHPLTHEIGTYIQKPGEEFVNITEWSLRYADGVTTVSPHYAEEMRHGTFDFGLKKLLVGKKDRFKGILNGLDTDVWNSEIDKHIFKRFDIHTIQAGKTENKVHLQKELGLTVDPTVPVFSFIARFVWQKGVDVLLEAMSSLAKLPIQLVVLGSGDQEIVSTFVKTEKKHPQQIKVISSFNENLAHKLFAASDFFLMPSIFEPCGLTQLMAMRYGVIPIVSRVGGLVDTVDEGKSGFFLKNHTPKALVSAVALALAIWQQKKKLSKMQIYVMNQDFSWKKSAQTYHNFYKHILSI